MYKLGGTLNFLRCPICLGFLIEPIQTVCGHRFCLNCFDKWQSKQGNKLKCPMDNGTINRNDFYFDKAFAFDTRLFEVNCNNYECDWIGQFSLLKAHATNCIFQTVPCQYASFGCRILATESEIKKHLKNCHIANLLSSESIQIFQAIDLSTADLADVPGFGAEAKRRLNTEKFTVLSLALVLRSFIMDRDLKSGVEATLTMLERDHNIRANYALLAIAALYKNMVHNGMIQQEDIQQ